MRLRSNEGPQRVGAIVGRAAATVGKVLRRLGYSRPPKAPQPTVLRYERERPGELLHIDIKKLGRFWHVGKHHVHVAVDDHTRIAYSEVLPSEGASDAVAFLERAYRWYAQQDITVESVMTDNGSAYRSALWREACVAHALRHLRTRPYTPRTNGKAERFIQTLLREWAYRYAYPSSLHRTRALSGWLRWYNKRRPHSSLAGLPPVSRVSHLCGQHT